MPVFKRDGLVFHYLDEGDPSGRPFVFQHGLGATYPNPPASSRARRASGCFRWTAAATGRLIPQAAHRSFPSRSSPTTSRR